MSRFGSSSCVVDLVGVNVEGRRRGRASLIWWVLMWKADGEEGRRRIVKRAYWFVVGRL